MLVGRMRNGILRIFKDANWPDVEIIEMTFENLSKNEADALKIFVTNTAGKEITMIDHESRNWIGVIVSPEVVFTEAGRGCKNSMPIKFMGSLV